MGRELSLSGSDIAVIKCFPAGGTPILGRDLAKAANMMDAEFVDTLQGLIILDVVKSTKLQFRTSQEIESISFSLNSGKLKEIRAATRPQVRKPGGKR